ncbi:hypothetical protein Ana3638_03300 [Anaerocolumna sedimenticola]|uniref:TPM domain-containing protein n=1 Tax=Anaerocolumna sedimenticola TaxID=2696063 RepID=A0A6P1TJ33_9FIRM|nr:TPM domain-containing protein [Anaerocolumna sedimenticola]QHQ59926.1 hypothetical protein Ana3638_03300 [Anaerocolumna sedimenticola]
MKKFYKIIIILLLLGLMPLRTHAAEKLPKPTDVFYVNDFADVIDAKAEDEMIEYGNRLNEKSGAQVVLVTVDFTNGDSLEDYAYKIFNKWGIGSKEKNNGLLILLSIGDDDYWAMQGEGLEDSLSSGKISAILNEYLEPDFAAKDYSAGAEKVYKAFIQELGGQLPEKTADTAETKDSGESSLEPAIQYTYDKADILSKKAETYINEKSNETYGLYGAGVYVVTKDKCKDGISFQDDAVNIYQEINGSSKDVLLVLYKEDDNYWVLPGEDAENFATEEVLRDILDNTLESQFAGKKYSQGAMDTADRFYNLFRKNLEEQKNNKNSYGKEDSKNSYDKEDSKNSYNKEQENLNKEQYPPEAYGMWGLLLLFLFFLSLRGRRRRRFRRQYGVPFNPYSRRHIRHYGSNGYWGSNGTPPMDYGGAGRSSSGGSFWGSSKGAGRSSSWGGSSGAGRSTTRSSFGGGGSSRGGGAGRSSGGIGRTAGHSSGAGRSTGGGGSSRGGGAGRKK